MKQLVLVPWGRTARAGIESWGEAHGWTDAEIDAAMAVAALVTGEKAKQPGPVVNVTLTGPRWKVVDGAIVPIDER